MASDCGLFVEVAHVDELRALVEPHGLSDCWLAEDAAYGYARGDSFGGCLRVAQGLDRRTITLDYSTVTASFGFALCESGRIVRLLGCDENGWQAIEGRPEPWEQELDPPPRKRWFRSVMVDILDIVELVGIHYRLTGLTEDAPPPPPRSVRPYDLAIQRVVEQHLEDRRKAAETATTLAEALAGIAFVPLRRELLLAATDLYVLVERDGSLATHEDDQWRALRVYKSAESVAEYATGWEQPLLQRTVRGPFDGAKVLALAGEAAANAIEFNLFGIGACARLDLATLERI